MMQLYISPTKWWRRTIKISITIWPTWMAMFLCPHSDNEPLMWNADDSVYVDICKDCGKLLFHKEQP